jgi:hypothetical protein
MVLDNFYQSRKTNWRLWGIVGIVLSFFVFSALICNFSEDPPEKVEKAISGSSRLKSVNRLCEEIPKPEGFKFLRKRISGNSYISALSFDYKTNRSYEEVKAFYLSLMPSEGWKIDDSLGFSRNNQKIQIGRFSWEEYYIYCAEEH